ncbi:MAG: DUF7711 family protein [Pseudonocardiaceae bacterium]
MLGASVNPNKSGSSATPRLDIAAVRERRGLPVVEPPPEGWRAQLCEERAVARRHLAAVLDRYHDRGWRRKHQGFGVYPEDHLWRAAQGRREVEDALRD